MVKVASWNIRGIGNEEKLATIKNFINNKNLDLLFIQETLVSRLPTYFSTYFPEGQFDCRFTPLGQGFCSILRKSNFINGVQFSLTHWPRPTLWPRLGHLNAPISKIEDDFPENSNLRRY